MKKFKGFIVGMLLFSPLASVGTVFAASSSKVSPTIVAETKDKNIFTVKNSQLEIGSKWSAVDNFDKATDSTGKALLWKDISKDVITKGEVNTEKVGSYEVVYEYAKKKRTAKIEVIEKKKEKEIKPVEIGLKELKTKNVTISQDSQFDPSSVFVEAVKSDGAVANWQEVSEQVKVTSTVDTTKVGNYQVTFISGELSKTSEVTVAEPTVTATEIKLKNTELTVGDAWSADKNFDYILMSDGSKLTWETVSKEIKVTGITDGIVNTAKAGTYKVDYLYKGITATATVTVKEITLKELHLKDTFIDVGSTWEPSQNFVKVLMSDGTELAWKDVSNEIHVTGDSGTGVSDEVVNTAKAGIYKVSYSYKGATGTVTVTVKEKVTPIPVTVNKIEVKDTTIEVGSTWEASQNFVKVVMSDGTELAWKDVSSEMHVTGNAGTGVTGEVVNTAKAGTYKVDYLYKEKTATATVTVKEKTVPVPATVNKIEVKDTTIEVGSKWEASQNFVKVVMSDGKELAWKDVSSEMHVTGNTGTGITGEVVNTAKAGTNKVEYSYKGQTATATVTVKEKAVTANVKKLELKNTTIEVGGKWEASQNFVKVVMSDGKELAWKDVSSEIHVLGNPGTGVTGEVVNTAKAGTYKVNYQYKDKTETATVTVVAKKTLVPAKTNTINNKKYLPQTNDIIGIGTIISGLLLLVGAFTVVVIKMRKVEKE